ncbi:hypothetical protein [Actinobacillus equuli]|uniref:hypothetical protein n=1 Tax=Actinobacillus equuli TaxID=718 RepID=UPI0024435B89|nr:hypothetical protein [Actinobacillus equuli]WGE84973.1 hypothetical protein NYR87_07540 [Actinobacillus equuli subsp. haemolyticus]
MTIDYQFEYLCHSMRMQLEQIIKYPNLVDVDEKEAIFNIEIIVKSVLDAFHNVYDAIQKLSNKQIDFYKYPELHLILSIRNAKHHNKNVKSLLFTKSDVVYVDFIDKNAFPCIIYPVRWSDISDYIKSEQKGAEKFPSLANYLNLSCIEEKMRLMNLGNKDVYMNIIPLMLRAGKILVKVSKEYIPNILNSVEAKFFLEHFENISDNYQVNVAYPYNKEVYKKDINNINVLSDKLSEMMFGDNKNPYLEEIKYSPKY